MKLKFVKSAIFGTLSLHSLLLSSAAIAVEPGFINERGDDEVTHAKHASAQNAESIIQKRLIGFDPKQAVETLTYLQQAGIQRFETDGSVFVSPEMVQDLMETAAVDEIEVRILQFKGDVARVKFAAHDIHKFDRSKIARARELAGSFVLKCDMDGK